jgi:hypothetical protein
MDQKTLDAHVKYFPLTTVEKFDRYIKKFYKVSSEQLKALTIMCEPLGDFLCESKIYCISYSELEDLSSIKSDIQQVYNEYYDRHFVRFNEQLLVKLKTPYTLYTDECGFNIIFKDNKDNIFEITLLERFQDFECYEFTDIDDGIEASEFKLFNTEYKLKSDAISEFFTNREFDHENQINKKGYYFALVKSTKGNKNVYYNNIVHCDGKVLKMGEQIISKDSVISWTKLFNK